ncbi:conserved hypothetical protein [Xanthomonas citri pv. aurantifolii str. ICPB 10535]|nr:conserved hypothetical protein [Xanthomonas citri pv. aurantifolii str. ICPB 10535]
MQVIALPVCFAVSSKVASAVASLLREAVHRAAGASGSLGRGPACLAADPGREPGSAFFVFRSGTSLEDGTPPRRAMPHQTVRDPGRCWFACLRRVAGSQRSPLTRVFAWHLLSAAATSARRDGVAARSGLAADRCPNR